MLDEDLNALEVKSKLPKAILFTLRYVIPGIATATGIAAWIFASLIQNSGPAWATYKPLQELGRPITQEQVIPELPYDQVKNNQITTAGSAKCEKSSALTKSAVQCVDSNGTALDPCYVVAGDTTPYEVFCFDPSPYRFSRYEITSWKDGLKMESPEGKPVYIFVRAPEVQNINDYSPKLISISGFQYDVCTITPNTDTAKASENYTCVSGATLTGGILGERPFYFARYTDATTHETTSQWIGWIVYG